MSPNGWSKLRQRLDEWSDDDLVKALADDRYEGAASDGDEKQANDALNVAIEQLAKLDHEQLVDEAIRLIEKHQTCEAGGHGIWVDREGYHVVWLEDDTRDTH